MIFWPCRTYSDIFWTRGIISGTHLVLKLYNTNSSGLPIGSWYHVLKRLLEYHAKFIMTSLG